MINTDELRSRFYSTFGKPAASAGWAPGRVNLIGGHVDYNQGLVLPIAVDKGIAAAVKPRQDSGFHAISIELDQRVDLEDLPQTPIDSFADYLIGVLHELHALGMRRCGWDVMTWGDLPIGSGLSSSAALEISFGLAACSASGFQTGRKELALACQRAENRFVGVNCGILDQFASALGTADHALLIDCRSLEYEPIALPEGALEIVVIDSGSSRTLAGSGYNKRRSECEQAARLLGVQSLRDASMNMLSEIVLDPVLHRRAKHVITEIERVREGVNALRSKDLRRFGELINLSHASLRYDYEVSAPELNLLCELAGNVPGVLGSRLVGAGFGGCTIHMTQRGIFDALRQSIVNAYEERTGLHPTAMLFSAAEGASLK